MDETNNIGTIINKIVSADDSYHLVLISLLYLQNFFQRFNSVNKFLLIKRAKNQTNVTI